MTNAAINLAAKMWTLAMSIDEQPFVGGGVMASETNIRWADQQIEDLHEYLILVADQLDEEWTEMIAHTASREAWEANCS